MTPHTLATLEQTIGHRFTRRELLEQALTHSSYAREHAANGDLSPDNEQLEFLGDAVLGLITSEELFARFPEFHEGELSKLRAHLVSESHLVKPARALDLGRFLRLGHGEEKSGGRDKTTILVDALEALIAAMYLDAGVDDARAFVLNKIVKPELRRLKRRSSTDTLPLTDYKSALQEAAHVQGRPQPSYVLVKEQGPQHRKTFTVEARVHERGRSTVEYAGRARGSSKKKAEQSAAKKALKYLQAAAPESHAKIPKS